MKKKSFLFGFITFFLMALIVPMLFIAKNNQKAYASNVNEEKTTFIYSPTYSVTIDEKNYFIDEYDSMLKVYDMDNSKFISELNISEIGTIVDATFENGNLFILGLNNNKISIFTVVLQSLEIKTLYQNLSVDYTKINTTKIDNVYFVTLTPTNSSSFKPLLILINEDFSLKNEVELNFANSILVNAFTNFFFVKNNTKYLLVIMNNTSNFSCKNYEMSDLDEAETVNVGSLNELIMADGYDNSKISQAVENSETIEKTKVNFLYINSSTFISYTFKSGNEYRTDIFLLDVANLKITFKQNSINNLTNDYILSNENKLVYSSKQNNEPLISQITFTYENENLTINTNSEKTAKNPSLTLNYYEINSFKYYELKSGETAKIAEKPWLLQNSETTINENANIIVLATIKINDNEVSDYLYCLYADNSKNHVGFVESSKFTKKEEVSLEDSNYKSKYNVFPDTKLYSLPTKYTSNTVINLNESKVLMEIGTKSTVTILDTICLYKCYDSVMVKVRVDNEIEGFIEANCLLHSAETYGYIETNATISQSGAKIYKQANTSSAVIATLDKAYRVKIIGKRDTKSGFTQIVFNDTDGNEISGYIETNLVKSDSWSTLQIIGSILVAINIGLLILILTLKKKKIGKSGEIYESQKHK